MILEPEKKFLFMKSTKTASTSFEIWLSSFCGPDAIITPTIDEDLRLDYGGRAPQNYGPRDEDPIACSKGRDAYAKCLDVFDVPPWGVVHFFNHMSLDQVLSQIEIGHFETLYSFGFTRNPFKRALSAYTWLVGCNPTYYLALSYNDHREHFHNMLASSFESTAKWLLSVRTGAEVSKVYRYEDIDFARSDIVTKLRWVDAQERPMPRAKSGFEHALGFPREELID